MHMEMRQDNTYARYLHVELCKGYEQRRHHLNMNCSANMFNTKIGTYVIYIIRYENLWTQIVLHFWQLTFMHLYWSCIGSKKEIVVASGKRSPSLAAKLLVVSHMQNKHRSCLEVRRWWRRRRNVEAIGDSKLGGSIQARSRFGPGGSQVKSFFLMSWSCWLVFRLAFNNLPEL